MKTNNKTTISIIIPTLNSGKTLSECLSAIRNQNILESQYEIIIADAGSTDSTIDIAKEFNVNKIVENKLKTGEAGKSAGIKEASADIIALIDSDNIIDDPEWINKMLQPFNDSEIIASEPLVYTHRKNDSALTRYFSMLGMNDPICLFLGNYDRECMITNKWTNLEIKQEDKGSYLKLTLTEQQFPTIGANGFVFRKEILQKTNWDPYFFDIDILYQTIAATTNKTIKVAKVKCGIVHLYCDKLASFYHKQDRRIKDFLFFSQEKQRSYPWEKQQNKGIVKFCIYTALIFPLIFQLLKGFFRKHDIAWLYHIPVCWITLFVYAKGAISKTLGIKPKQKNRDTWQKK